MTLINNIFKQPYIFLMNSIIADCTRVKTINDQKFDIVYKL